MEIDPPAPPRAPPEVTFRDRLAASDWSGALEAAEILELQIQLGGWAADKGDPQVLLSLELALYLVTRDLDNARHLWRRLDPVYKSAGGPVSQVWEVGKCLWKRELPEAYTAIAAVTPHGQEMTHVLTALVERVRADEMALVARAYRRIKANTLAAKLGLDTQAAVQVAVRAGWKVDEAAAALEPVSTPVQSREIIGLPQLDQLVDYIRFLEQKPVTGMPPSNANASSATATASTAATGTIAAASSSSS